MSIRFKRVQVPSAPPDSALGSRDRAGRLGAPSAAGGKSGLSVPRGPGLEVTPPVRKDSGANRDACALGASRARGLAERRGGRGNAAGLRGSRDRPRSSLRGNAEGETAKPGPGSKAQRRPIPAATRGPEKCGQRNRIRLTSFPMLLSRDRCYGGTLRSGRRGRGSIPRSRTGFMTRMRCQRLHAWPPARRNEFDSRHPLIFGLARARCHGLHAGLPTRRSEFESRRPLFAPG